VNFEQFLPTIAELMAKGAPTPLETLDELDFYAGYRKRLENKLNQKVSQITRAEQLLRTLSEQEKPSIKASLHQAVSERTEIQELLDQIDEYLEKITKRD